MSDRARAGEDVPVTVVEPARERAHVDVFRSALVEAGRPDLAEFVYESPSGTGHGITTARIHDRLTEEDAFLIQRARAVAYLADDGNNDASEGWLVCPLCWFETLRGGGSGNGRCAVPYKAFLAPVVECRKGDREVAS